MDEIKKILQWFKTHKIARIFCIIGFVVILWVNGYIAQTVEIAQKTNQTKLGWENDQILSASNVASSNLFVCLQYAFSVIGLRTLLTEIGVALLVGLKVNGKLKKNRLMDARGFKLRDTGLYGESQYLQGEEFDEVLKIEDKDATKNIILGKQHQDVPIYSSQGKNLTPENSVITFPQQRNLNRNICVVGAPGCGKSRGFSLIQIIQCSLRGESIVVTDTKGDLFKKTASFLAKKGYTVRILNLIDPALSDSWNMLKALKRNKDKLEQMVSIFADVIIKNTNGRDQLDYWANNELNLLKALCLYILECLPEEQQTMQYLYKNILCELSSPALIARITTNIRGSSGEAPWKIFLGTEKNMPNIINGLSVRLSLFSGKDVCDMTSSEDFDLVAPGQKKCAYFVLISDQTHTYQLISSLFFTMFFQQVVKYADDHGGELKVPVTLILDEFANIGIIPDFSTKLASVRSRGIQTDILLQSNNQLESRYLKTAQEIIGCCDIYYYLGSSDETTTEFISNRSGKITTEVSSQRVDTNPIHFIPAQNDTETVSSGQRMLLDSNETFKIAPEDALISIRGHSILKVKKISFDELAESKKFEEKMSMEDFIPYHLRKEYGIQNELFKSDLPDLFDSTGKYVGNSADENLSEGISESHSPNSDTDSVSSQSSGKNVSGKAHTCQRNKEESKNFLNAYTKESEQNKKVDNLENDDDSIFGEYENDSEHTNSSNVIIKEPQGLAFEQEEDNHEGEAIGEYEISDED